MTLLRKITFLIIIIILFCIGSIIFKRYYISLIFMIAIIPLSTLWYKLIIEELVVYQIMRNGYKLQYEKIIELFGKKGKSAINRLNRKHVIEQSNNNVILKKRDYKFSMTKYRGESES